ncbi:hypothetical protein [Romboutsia ilealis]|uniref:hypothetical protein n=1 Tax=Romboutsia ilealis TaxID=1115758 RepID=UPI00259CE45B|nr:hypothetical protein [Romboutsia ilealis]
MKNGIISGIGMVGILIILNTFTPKIIMIPIVVVFLILYGISMAYNYINRLKE